MLHPNLLGATASGGASAGQRHWAAARGGEVPQGLHMRGTWTADAMVSSGARPVADLYDDDLLLWSERRGQLLRGDD